MKDFIIFYTNSKGNVAKFRIKNMFDSDEMEEIAFVEKKKETLSEIIDMIFAALSIVMVCFMFVCFYKTIHKMIHKPVDSFFLLFMSFIGILMSFIGFLMCCYDDLFLKTSLKEQIFLNYIIRNGCEYLLQYLNDCSDQEWSSLKSKAYNIQNLLAARALPLGGLLYLADSQNQAAAISIAFYRTCLKMNRISYDENGDQVQRNYIIYIDRVIKNCQLEKDTVEYDFMKKELRIPLEFDEMIESAD